MRAKRIGEHRRWGRLLTLGTGGLSGVVALLMVLAPSAAGAVVHPQLVMAAPYLGTASSGSSYLNTNGCGKATAPALTWNATSGMITGKNTASAKSCKLATGPVGSFSSGYGASGVSVGIPFKVASGNHSIATTLSVTMSSARSASHGGCSKSLANTNPPMFSSSSSLCIAQNSLSFNFNVQVYDLNNNSWFSNYSYWYNASYQTWENSTYCYNYGTPTCSNFTGWSNFSYGFGYNAKGSFNYMGSGSFTIWTNGTNMVKGHHYLLVVSLGIDHSAYISWSNIAKKWVAAAAASITMSGTGKGAQIVSVTIT